MDKIIPVIRLISRWIYPINKLWNKYIMTYIILFSNTIYYYLHPYGNILYNKISSKQIYIEYFTIASLFFVIGTMTSHISLFISYIFPYMTISVKWSIITTMFTLFISSIWYFIRISMTKIPMIFKDIAIKYPVLMMSLFSFISPMIKPLISLMSNNNNLDNDKNNFMVTKNGIAIFNYMSDGEKYKLYIPIITNKRKIRKIRMRKVVAIYNNEDNNEDNKEDIELEREEDITQEACMPYIVTANDLKCKSIRIYNLNDKVITEYSGSDKIEIT